MGVEVKEPKFAQLLPLNDTCCKCTLFEPLTCGAVGDAADPVVIPAGEEERLRRVVALHLGAVSPASHPRVLRWRRVRTSHN